MSMNTRFRPFAALAAAFWLAAAPSAVAATKIYTCEINGMTIYTSRPSGSCRSPDLPAIGSYSSSRYDAYTPAAPVQRSAKSTKRNRNKSLAVRPQSAPIRPAPAMVAAPKPSANNSRRSILETELGNERKALSDAQKALAQARGAKNGSIDSRQISSLESSVLDRQQNIQALQRELGRM